MEEQPQNLPNNGIPVDPRRLFIALRKQRWLIACATVVGTVAGAAMAKSVVEPVFEARSVVECDRCSRPDMGDRELATLQESVKLPQHLEKARQRLGLAYPLEKMERDVDVNASIESRLIHVSARGKSGELAAGLANIVVEAFVETRLEVERDKLDQRVRTLTIDSEKAHATATDCRKRYDLFRSENNIADLPAERQAAIQEAARLRSELAIAHGDEQAERARALALHRASSKQPAMTILQQTEDLPDAKRLVEAKGQLTAARARLSADHPRVQAHAAEVEVLERKFAIANESVTTGRTIGRNPQWDLAQQGILEASASQEAASTRQSTYEKLAHGAAEAVARLSKIEGQASALLSNLQNAERHLATIEFDLKVAEDAARTPSTGLRILAAARPPSMPVKSFRRAVVVIGAFVASFITSFVVLLLELRGLRVQTASELVFWGKGPVIAVSQWPRSPAAGDDLVADILEPLHCTHGKTLVAAASARELAHAYALANRLREHFERDASTDELACCSIDAFESAETAPALRRAARKADRVLVVVLSGLHSGMALRSFVDRIGNFGHIGFVLVGVHEDHTSVPTPGDGANTFWNARRPSLLRPNGRQQRFDEDLSTS